MENYVIRMEVDMTKNFTLILGIVLLGVGVVGTFTGGHNHQLLIFGINMTHNMVHILSGAAAIVLAVMGSNPARLFCLVFGIVYGLVAVAGFLKVDAIVRLLNLNMADNFLHLAIALPCLYFGTSSLWEEHKILTRDRHLS
jgi:hypothetical protein